MADRPTYFRVLTDPHHNQKSHPIVEFVPTQFGDNCGPFPASHLESLGIRLKSLGSGFPRESGVPTIIYEYLPRMPLRDFESAGSCWDLSPRALELLSTFAAKSIDFVPAKVSLRHDGIDDPAGPRWMCDVVRHEDAVDEGASKITWMVKHPRYDLVGCDFVFKSDLPEDLHLFRMWKDPTRIVCSKALRDAIVEAKLTGVILEKL